MNIKGKRKDEKKETAYLLISDQRGGRVMTISQ
jgi:hypothetical protein